MKTTAEEFFIPLVDEDALDGWYFGGWEINKSSSYLHLKGLVYT